tara:strand:- start:5279 stop:5848 length:570 start_codon:yes stop_codon:yes gene_type:complete
MKKNNFIILGFGLGFISGIFSYKFNLFPISLNRKNMYPVELEGLSQYPFGVFMTKYEPETPFFSDRVYTDTMGVINFDNCYIIQLPRHYKKPIKIKLEDRFSVYRILSENNKHNWIYSDFKHYSDSIFVNGRTCYHSIVVFKNFEKGEYILDQRDDVASSPIIIKSDNFEALKKIKINGYKISYGLKKN